eukprot:TRINITY_DN3175_c5_g1_i1.p1 TRINITY_DN3175_c5_g1~~TRINITY_DN3175_c5_g1_i1.p1  ORF type:complete len:950 (+),score=154.08 TRINITY_DN3175_c5_g1_i1:95-2944(+)
MHTERVESVDSVGASIIATPPLPAPGAPMLNGKEDKGQVLGQVSEDTTLGASKKEKRKRYDGREESPPARHEEAVKAPIAEAWCRWLLNHKRPTATFWITLSLLSIIAAVRLVDVSTLDVEAPSSTLARQAKKAIAEFFPNLEESSAFVFVFTNQNVTHHTVLSPVLKGYIANLTNDVRNWREDLYIQSMDDYYTFKSMGLNYLAQKMLSTNLGHTIVTIAINAAVSDSITRDFAKYLGSYAGPPGYNMALVGAPIFEEEAHRGAKNDLAHLVGVVMPLTLLVMAFLLRSLRLVVIGAINFGICSSISFAFMWFLQFGLPVNTTTPAFLMALIIATSISYTLILLSRYREALLDRRRNGLGVDGNIATKQAIVHAGETVIVSGVTAAFCFIGLAIYPMATIQSFGVGCGLTVLLVVLVCLMITPLTLLAFLHFWEKSVKENPRWDAWDNLWSYNINKIAGRDLSSSQHHHQSAAAQGHEDYDSDWNDSFRDIVPDRMARTPSQNNTEPNTTQLIKDSDAVDRYSIWYLLASITTKFPYNIIAVIVVTLALLPIDLKSTQFEVTADSLSLVPSDSSVLRGYDLLGREFAYGEVYPYTILVNSSDGQNITDPERWFNVWEFFFYELANVTLERDNYDTAVMTKGHDGAMNNITRMKECVFRDLPDAGCAQLKYAWAYVADDEKAMWCKYTSRIAPMTSEGRSWLKAARKLEPEGFEVLYSGEPAEVIDSMNGVYSNFGLMIGVTGVMVFIITVVSFKSVLIPFRAVCTRAISLAFVYGMATITYRDNGLSWLGDNFSSITREITYTTALTCLPILVGLGLGPDFFLMTRVVECRKGTNTEECREPTRRAVILGVTRTGHIISAAGTIMIVCFLGLLTFSKVTVIHQLAFFVTLGLVFETFVTRSLVVPAFTTLLGLIYEEANWWPLALTNWNTIGELRGMLTKGIPNGAKN